MRHTGIRSLRAAAGLALVLAAAGLAARASAGGPPDRPGPGPHGPPPFDRMLERHAERLGLDDATRARIHEIVEASRPEGERLHEEMSGLRKGLHELLAVDAPDERLVMEQADRIGALETALRKQRLGTMLRIRALLTPEQRQELVRIHEERRAERRGRSWHRWRGGPGAPDGPDDDDSPPDMPPDAMP